MTDRQTNIVNMLHRIFAGEMYSMIRVKWPSDHFAVGLMKKIDPLFTEIRSKNDFLHFRRQ